MKNRWKHIFIPVLAMALCLSLAACGNSDDVAGEDWRTTGVVVGSGTITHDSESVDVLVTADPRAAPPSTGIRRSRCCLTAWLFPMNYRGHQQQRLPTPSPSTIMNGDEESDVLVEIRP